MKKHKRIISPHATQTATSLKKQKLMTDFMKKNPTIQVKTKPTKNCDIFKTEIICCDEDSDLGIQETTHVRAESKKVEIIDAYNKSTHLSSNNVQEEIHSISANCVQEVDDDIFIDSDSETNEILAIYNLHEKEETFGVSDAFEKSDDGVQEKISFDLCSKLSSDIGAFDLQKKLDDIQETADKNAVSRFQELRTDFGAFDSQKEDSVNFDLKEISNNLNLNEWTRCRVLKIDRDKSFDLILKVALEKTQEKTCTCRLKGSWSQVKVEIDDIASILAKWNEQFSTFLVDNDYGFCVVNPDNLISNTSVVGSLFCRRRSVIQQNFSGIDPPSKVMVIGTFIHQLFQEVLSKSLKTCKEISSCAKELLESRETAFTLYTSQMSRAEVEHEIETFIPRIVSFIEVYFDGKTPDMIEKNMFQGTISEIDDIEENFWSHKLGIKGKIDLSVRIKQQNGRISKNFSSPIPLELKTGRATFSNEHKGQVILYQMMLNAEGLEINTGLLLYLRDGIIREVHASRNDQRELIMVRNDLNYYLNKSVPSDLLVDEKFLQPIELPDPISHHSACSACPYSTICCTFGATDHNMQLDESHPWVRTSKECIKHLKQTDYDYFLHWCKILLLENKETDKSYNLRSLWTDEPEERQRNGTAIINLKLKTQIQLKGSRFLHEFYLLDDQNENPDLTLSGINVGEYVIVSSKNRLSIASGIVCDITKFTISINLERNLLKKYTEQSFIVDKYESKASNIFNFTNLGILLDCSERSNQLRTIIIDRQLPEFTKMLPKCIPTAGFVLLQELNSIQRKAALKALTMNNFMLIKGLPGTGKTQTLVTIIRLFHLMGKSIIITSHTHSAVDNLLLRLKSHSLPMMRFGSISRINSQLHQYSEDSLTAKCITEEQLHKVYSSATIVGVTCLGSAHSIFSHRKFDVCIVDEATQVLQTTVLRPLFFCDKFILVGDPDQLPPMVRSKEARKCGANESLFHRLDSAEATSILTLQYRMNKTIAKLANELTYDGILKCANEKVALATIKIKRSSMSSLIPLNEKWLQPILHPNIDQSVCFLDTKDCSERNSSFISLQQQRKLPNGCQRNDRNLLKYSNFCEASVILHIIKLFLTSGYNAERIGIIAPYSNQVELLRRLTRQHEEFYCAKDELKLNFASVEVNTVDQYQGRDKDIIFYSCSKTGQPAGPATGCGIHKEMEILEDKRRLTVAITRAKFKLIIIGDAKCLQQYTPFRDMLEKIPTRYKMVLENEKNGFDWQCLLNELDTVLSA